MNILFAKFNLILLKYSIATAAILAETTKS